MVDWRVKLWAKKRISEVPDGATARLAGMERQDPNPDDGAIEVGALKEADHA